MVNNNIINYPSLQRIYHNSTSSPTENAKVLIIAFVVFQQIVRSFLLAKSNPQECLKKILTFTIIDAALLSPIHLHDWCPGFLKNHQNRFQVFLSALFVINKISIAILLTGMTSIIFREVTNPSFFNRIGRLLGRTLGVVLLAHTWKKTYEIITLNHPKSINWSLDNFQEATKRHFQTTSDTFSNRCIHSVILYLTLHFPEAVEFLNKSCFCQLPNDYLSSMTALTKKINLSEFKQELSSLVEISSEIPDDNRILKLKYLFLRVKKEDTASTLQLCYDMKNELIPKVIKFEEFIDLIKIFFPFNKLEFHQLFTSLVKSFENFYILENDTKAIYQEIIQLEKNISNSEEKRFLEEKNLLNKFDHLNKKYENLKTVVKNYINNLDILLNQSVNLENPVLDIIIQETIKKNDDKSYIILALTNSLIKTRNELNNNEFLEMQKRLSKFENEKRDEKSDFSTDFDLDKSEKNEGNEKTLRERMVEIQKELISYHIGDEEEVDRDGIVMQLSSTYGFRIGDWDLIRNKLGNVEYENIDTALSKIGLNSLENLVLKEKSSLEEVLKTLLEYIEEKQKENLL